MNRIMKAALFAVIWGLTALPAIAAEDTQAEALKTRMKQVMQQHPEAIMELMGNPNHLLAMAYGDGMFGFATAMKKAASRGDEIPPELARTAVKEMKRDLDQMEKQHGEALKTISTKNKKVLQDLPALMQGHLTEVKKHIDHLSQVTERDHVVSKDVMGDLDYLLEHCQMRKKGMHGGGMAGGDVSMLHSMMKQKMAENGDLENMVDRMNQASGNEKLDLMAEILSRLVEEKAGRGGMPENHPMIMPPSMDDGAAPDDMEQEYPQEDQDED